MKIFWQILYDLWRVALILWVALVLMENIHPGSVQRFLNLEYFLYFLLFLFILWRSRAHYFFS